jgi:hypothetical protein
MFVLSCKNGMVATQYGTRRAHLGKRIEEDELSIYRDETIEADDKAFWMKVQDQVRAAASEATFAQIVATAKELASFRIAPEVGPVEAVKRLANKADLSESEEKGVLDALITGADLTAWGLINAVTRYAQDVDSYDRSTELEVLGGTIHGLPENELRQLIAA